MGLYHRRLVLDDIPVATGKTPSDVFGLVSLATRRLQLIMGS